MPKVAETLIQSAFKADPLTVAIVFLGVVACGLIWLVSLTITKSKGK